MIVILCQGQAMRLRGAITGPKHLIEFAGEPILARTLRLIAECPMPPRQVVVVGPASLGEVSRVAGAVQRELPSPGECVLQGLAASSPMWIPEVAVTVLLGDVVWSRKALYPFLQASFTIEMPMFAASHDLSSTDGEIFGFHAHEESYTEIVNASRKCKHNTGTEQAGHMRRLLHRPLAGGLEQHAIWVIDDWTCDIDEPIDLTHIAGLEDCDAWDDLMWAGREVVRAAPNVYTRDLARAIGRVANSDQPRCKCGRPALMTCITCQRPRGSCNCTRQSQGGR